MKHILAMLLILVLAAPCALAETADDAKMVLVQNGAEMKYIWTQSQDGVALVPLQELLDALGVEYTVVNGVVQIAVEAEAAGDPQAHGNPEAHGNAEAHGHARPAADQRAVPRPVDEGDRRHEGDGVQEPRPEGRDGPAFLQQQGQDVHPHGLPGGAEEHRRHEV